MSNCETNKTLNGYTGDLWRMGRGVNMFCAYPGVYGEGSQTIFLLNKFNEPSVLFSQMGKGMLSFVAPLIATPEIQLELYYDTAGYFQNGFVKRTLETPFPMTAGFMVDHIGFVTQSGMSFEGEQMDNGSLPSDMFPMPSDGLWSMIDIQTKIPLLFLRTQGARVDIGMEMNSMYDYNFHLPGNDMGKIFMSLGGHPIEANNATDVYNALIQVTVDACTSPTYRKKMNI